MRSASLRAIATCLLASNLILISVHQGVASSIGSVAVVSSGNRTVWQAPNNLGVFVRKLVDGRAVCIEAGAEQARSIRDRDPNTPVSGLESNPSIEPQGLRILMRGTSQLRGFPMASAAFERAAARWEAVIQTRATVVIDVDFGPTMFGKPFDDNVAGTTYAQVLAGNALYPAVRASLISKATSTQRSSLLNSLHGRVVETDAGSVAGIAASAATFRALDLIGQTADPDAELSSFGMPPAICINSRFGFDFDQSDGVAQDKLDFEGIVLHEIGHILGFVSCVGQQEANSSTDAELSIWDLFRGRPESIKGNFAAAQRILESGGEQCFFAGGDALPLSTARPDGTAGDGRHAAHWKDDNLSGRYLGVMDSTIGPGEAHLITDNDTAVLGAIGFLANSVTQSPFLLPLVSGRPQPGVMIAPPADLGFLSHLQYSIAVPPAATQLRVELNGNQAVDLFVRFGERVFIRGFHPESDHVSAGKTGFEAVTITPSSTPPLRVGTYFIAVANFGPGDADFTVTATVTGDQKTFAPSIFSIRPRLEGDMLNLTYAAIDLDCDVVRAELTILDKEERPVGSPSSFAIASGNAIRIESQLSMSGLSVVPTAVAVALVLIDRDGKRSPEAAVDFSSAEAGGLTVNSASFDGSRLTIKTSGLAENLEVEINGRVVAPPRPIKMKGASGKLIVKGDAGQLTLQRGANRIRVKNILGWSNILIFTI